MRGRMIASHLLLQECQYASEYAIRNFVKYAYPGYAQVDDEAFMATMTISLPDPMKEWIEAQIRQGDYASTSVYVRDLVRRDRERRAHPELTLEDLRRIVDDARAKRTEPAQGP